MSTGYCRFCSIVANEPELVTRRGDLVAAFDSEFPATAGHVLVVPLRHVRRVADLSEAEWAQLFSVTRAELVRLSEKDPDGFTIGINDGEAAGQSVGHVHVHVVPRREGDVVNPKGGVLRGCPDSHRYLS